MKTVPDAHLARLADPPTIDLLAGLGLSYCGADANAASALRLLERAPDRPSFVGFLGGASSGKSTLFNSLLGREVSAISAHAHETRGPIIAVHRAQAAQLEVWLAERLLLADYEATRLAGDAPSPGDIHTLPIHVHEVEELAGVVLFDLPDATSQMSADEGAVACNLLPLLDGIVVVVDEERWYDAAVFAGTMDAARDYGPRLWGVFNRTEHAASFNPDETEQLAAHARSLRLDDACTCGFVPGVGYRPVGDDARSRLAAWATGKRPLTRREALLAYLQRRCAAVVEENVARAEAHETLLRTVDRTLAEIAADTSLSFDLLTAEERGLLGVGHRLVPLYDLYHSVRTKLRGWGLGKWTAKDIDFDKRPDRLAEIVSRNFEMRFGKATDRIDTVVAQSPYFDQSTEPGNEWTPPDFDAETWAQRIRAHLDAWKEESTQQARTGDMTALSIGVPLLLADILFLGGAGVTLTWASVWVAGLLGGKGLARIVQRSPAFAAYQTTVRSYQAYLRETLTQQWEANLARWPRRHLKMTDQLLEALMHAATPTGRTDR